MSEDTSKVLVIPGEWSGDVAGAACAVGAAAGLVSTLFFWRTAWKIDLATSSVVLADEQWVDGSFAQRATLVVVLMSLWLASLVFIATAVLAVIEARAVTQRQVVAESPPEAPGTGERNLVAQSVSEAVKAVSVIADKLTRARGTVVLGVAGMVLVVGAFTVLGAVLGDDGGGTVADDSEQTATPGADEATVTEVPAPADDGTATGDAP